MAGCAAIARLAEAAGERELAAPERKELVAAELALRRRFEGADPSAPLSRQESLFVHYAARANGPRLLNHPERARAASEFIERAWRDDPETPAAP